METSPLEAARALVAVLDEMAGSKDYSDRAALDRMQRLHAELRPAWHQFSGGFPNVDLATYPPGVWFPRIWERARALLAQLEANPDWTPTRTVASAGAEAAWVPQRLWAFIKGSVRGARETGRSSRWTRVTREAVLFLENEIRLRADLDDVLRSQLAEAAFGPQGRLRLRKDAAQQEAWMLFVKGLLAGLAQPDERLLLQHSESFAMGMVGAVSSVLVTLDEEIGLLPM